MNTRTLKRLTKQGCREELRDCAEFFPIFDGIDTTLSTPELREAMLKRLKTKQSNG